MFNNKGQSLVLFVLLIPIILLIIFMVIDIGRSYTFKSSLDNINKIAIEYGVKNIEDREVISDIKKIIYKNTDKVDSVYVTIENGRVYVEIIGYQEMIIDTGIDILKVKSSLYGYMMDNKIIIERNK